MDGLGAAGAVPDLDRRDEYLPAASPRSVVAAQGRTAHLVGALRAAPGPLQSHRGGSTMVCARVARVGASFWTLSPLFARGAGGLSGGRSDARLRARPLALLAAVRLAGARGGRHRADRLRRAPLLRHAAAAPDLRYALTLPFAAGAVASGGDSRQSAVGSRQSRRWERRKQRRRTVSTAYCRLPTAYWSPADLAAAGADAAVGEPAQRLHADLRAAGCGDRGGDLGGGLPNAECGMRSAEWGRIAVSLFRIPHS